MPSFPRQIGEIGVGGEGGITSEKGFAIPLERQEKGQEKEARKGKKKKRRRRSRGCRGKGGGSPARSFCGGRSCERPNEGGLEGAVRREKEAGE